MLLSWTVTIIFFISLSWLIWSLIARVSFTGGFKKPREFLWITGVILAVTTVSFGVTGYSLPWDQVGYWALQIVTSLPEALDDLIPGLGKISLLSLRGTFSVSQATLTRFYSIHSFLLPLVSLILLILHFSLLRKQGISGPL
jgi:cytochrome b6